ISAVSTSLTARPFRARLTGTVQFLPTKQLCVAGKVSWAHGSHEPVPSTQAVPVRHGSPACSLQVPPAHVSAPVQKRSSVQGSVFGSWVHAPRPSQTSVVQTSESSAQPAPSSARASLGQAGPVPVQTSAKSQSASAAARHTLVESRNASAGHVADAPLQLSAASQIPPDSRQTVAEETTVSAGQS